MIHVKRNSRGCIWPCSYSMFVGLLSLFLLFLGTPVHSGTIELPQTGQTSCYNSAGGTISCFGTGQDGDFLVGVAWPGPRFSLFLRDCVIDNLTGLMWSRNAFTLAAQTSWANSVINPPGNYFACGFADWRLPNVNELQSLVNAGKVDGAIWLSSLPLDVLGGFFFPQSIDPIYWTSTSSADDPEFNAWNISMIDGSVIAKSKLEAYLIWPVRGVTNPPPPAVSPPAQIPKTGQTVSITPPSFDDGYFQVGTPWPNPRFTETYCDSTGPCAEQIVDCDIISSNNVVTDNLTGLMWSTSANLDGLKTWTNALSYTEDISICGYADWRLPNSKELFSLIDRSQSNPALSTLHPFTNVRSGIDDLYWSSTTYASDPTWSWTIDMLLGNTERSLKTETAFVWPVRGGQARPYLLTVTKEGNGQGKVTAPGLSCVGKTCGGAYESYEVVTLTAKAQGDSVFTGWGGEACTGVVDSTCTFTVTADTTVTATFIPEVKISVDPKSLNFKNLKQNVPTSLSVTVTNAGASDLLLSLPLIAEDPMSVFAITGNDCPAALPSPDSCTITVTATSPDYDQKTAQLQIPSNDPKKETTIVKLKAKAKPPKIAKKPSSLNFKKVSVGVPIDLTLALTNKGVTDLEIPSTGLISITGDHPGDFSFSPNTCPALANSQSCTLTVTFTPSATGKRSAVLKIPSNDPKKPVLTVNLKGTGE